MSTIRRRILRTCVIATSLIAGLTLPTAAAFADTSALDKASAEFATEDNGGLIAAGGGMAAAGAAGLGFAMLRRGRTED